MTEFPFTALVGQETLKTGLLLNAVHPRIGGLLIRGHRGTAKTTAVRALRSLLPPIDVVEGCRFSCDPAEPGAWCDECVARRDAGGTIAATTRQARIVELPVNATEDRVAGTLDMERALRHGERAFQEGILGAANRGVLYVDEVNLLDDHLVDLLLDAAAKGVNFVEREGISFRHPSRFVLVGTMNPEEGELRPQLLDRFGLAVDVEGVGAVDERRLILERVLAWERDPEAFAREWQEAEHALGARLARARRALPSVRYTTDDARAIAAMVAELGTEGHRGELVVLRAACAHAALDDRTQITPADVLTVVPMALAHRLPADAAGVPDAARLQHLEERWDDARRKGNAEADLTDSNEEPAKKK